MGMGQRCKYSDRGKPTYW